MTWRVKRAKDMTPAQIALKKDRDTAYKADSDALATPFYQKKHSVGVTVQEEQDFTDADHKLWNDEVQARIAEGLYEEFDELVDLKEKRTRIIADLAKVDASIATLEA